MTLKVKTKGYRGNIVKGATVVSNDPKTPKRFLRISAQVKPLISCSPSPNITLTKPYGQEVTKVLALWSPIYPEFKITGVESLLRGVTAQILKVWVEEGKTHYNVSVTFGREMQVGPFRGIVKVTTNLEKKPVYNIRVSGVVEGPFSVLPRRSSMFSDPMMVGGMAAAGFNLYGNRYGLKVLKVVTNMDRLVVRLIPVEEGRKYYIVAIWPGGPIPRNPYNGWLEVHTNSKIQPIIKIPLTIYARKTPETAETKGPKGAVPPPVRPPNVRGKERGNSP